MTTKLRWQHNNGYNKLTKAHVEDSKHTTTIETNQFGLSNDVSATLILYNVLVITAEAKQGWSETPWRYNNPKWNHFKLFLLTFDSLLFGLLHLWYGLTVQQCHGPFFCLLLVSLVPVSGKTEAK